jgi:demethylmenaquinone methyltransferase/2-methoxy-6-polyprenyl-1,4-benzoquinol methylase
MPDTTSENKQDGLKTAFGFTKVGIGEKQGKVSQVFDRVAERYDLMNDMMSGGLHRLWKAAMISELHLPRSDAPFKHLDVAGGTGDIAFRSLEKGGQGLEVTVFDINPNMLGVGERRAAKKGLERIEFVEGNAEDLPFEDNSFDAYTIAFGIRNVPDVARALSEAYRVLKPGGRFLVLEFSQVDLPILDKVYEFYSFKVIPELGALIGKDRDAYQYLVESIRTFPDQPSFAASITQAGFKHVKWQNLTGGIAALHSGWKV